MKVDDDSADGYIIRSPPITLTPTGAYQTATCSVKSWLISVHHARPTSRLPH